MSGYIVFTAVERASGSSVQEIPATGSSCTLGVSAWERSLESLGDSEVREELESLIPDEFDDVPSWEGCAVAGRLSRLLKAARRELGLTQIAGGDGFRVVCERSDGQVTESKGQVALLAGDDTLLLSPSRGLLTRINRVEGSSLTEPLRAGLVIQGNPVGFPEIVVVARVEGMAVAAPPEDPFGVVLHVADVAKAHRARVQVSMHE